MLIFLILIILLTMLFLFLNHPLSFGLILLMQTIIISMISGMMNFNFWFSYILFIIMIGGMLILFIYMTSIASNEKFKFSYKLFLIFLTLLFIMFILTFIDNFPFYDNLNSYDIQNQNYKFKNNLSMSKFLNWPNNLILYMMIMYLLITLIMVVKITNTKYGPLRQKI